MPDEMSDFEVQMIHELTATWGRFARLIFEADNLGMWDTESENFKSICKAIGTEEEDLLHVIKKAKFVLGNYGHNEVSEALIKNNDGFLSSEQEVEDE